MNKLLIPVVTLAMVMLPAAANAEQCRNTASGKFAKCGSLGAVLASQYVAKGKTKASHAMAPMAAPAAKPGFMSMMKAKAKPTPAAMPVKAARCKTAKGKFIKCGMPGALPA